jgi:hypothetical protein
VLLAFREEALLLAARPIKCPICPKLEETQPSRINSNLLAQLERLQTDKRWDQVRIHNFRFLEQRQRQRTIPRKLEAQRNHHQLRIKIQQNKTQK